MMVVKMMMFLLIVIINLSVQVTSSHLHVSPNLTTWKEAKRNCNFAKRADVCDTSGGNCVIKLTGNDVIFPSDSPVWVDSYLLRSHFIYNDGCHVVNMQLFDGVTTHYKIGPNNDVNECASKCGDTYGYALYEYNCFCVSQTAESYLRDVKYDNCNIKCRDGSYEDCGGTPTTTDYYVTYYKVFKPSGDVQTSCIALHWNEDYRVGLTFKDCKDKHGFACVLDSTSDPVFHNFDNSTWEEAKKYCFDIGGRISHKLTINAAGVGNMIPDAYYWSAYHRRYMYRWDTTLDEGVFGLQGCLSLTPDYGFALRDCNLELPSLCAEDVIETTTTAMPTTTTTTSTTQKPTTTSTATTTTTPQPPTTTQPPTTPQPTTTSTATTTTTPQPTTTTTSTKTRTTSQPTTTSLYINHTFDKVMTVKTSTVQTQVTATTPEPTPSTTTSTNYIQSTTEDNNPTITAMPPMTDRVTAGPVPTASSITYSQSELVYVLVPVVVILLLLLVVMVIISANLYRKYRRKQMFRLYSINDNSSLVGNELLQDIQNEEYSYLPRLQPRVDFFNRPDDNYDHIRMYRERPQSSRLAQNRYSSFPQPPGSFKSFQNQNPDGSKTVNNDVSNDENHVVMRDIMLLDLDRVKYKSTRSDSLTNYLPMTTDVSKGGNQQGTQYHVTKSHDLKDGGQLEQNDYELFDNQQRNASIEYQPNYGNQQFVQPNGFQTSTSATVHNPPS